jgi:predicted phage replisome organizer
VVTIADEKRYYWLKLKDDFFSQKEIKKLRKIAGGDTYTIIYLKMQLLSLKNNGTLLFENIEDTFCEELALEIDEEAENIKFTLMFLQKYGLLEEVTSTEFLLPQTVESIGSEGQCAARVRKHRAKGGKNKTLHCNNKMLPNVTCNGEIDIDTHIEKDIDYTLYFETFWTKYPRKTAKKDAIKAWNKIKLTDSLLSVIMDGLENAIKSVDWVKDGGKFIPYPASWLNGERWTDEVQEAQVGLFTEKPKMSKREQQLDELERVMADYDRGNECKASKDVCNELRQLR